MDILLQSIKSASCLLLAFLASITTVHAGVVNPTKPNILWITVEDITTFGGSYGQGEVATPNIDKLARNGVLFNRAYTVSGVCSPSRFSLITGMYPTSVGAQHMRTGNGGEKADDNAKNSGTDKDKVPGLPSYSVVLPPQVRAFPEILRGHGYYTSNNHKTDYQFDAPVTVWDDNGPAASYRNRPSGKPFFSVYNFFQTHESLLAMGRDKLLVDPASISVPPIYPDTAAVRNDIARLYSNIIVMDRHVGELIQMLKDDGVYDNTIIFLFSDNGGNLPWMKREVLERGTHVPLIVRFPKSEHGGEIVNELVSGVDLAPTVLSLAGVPVPDYMQGQAILGKQKANAPRRYVFAARDRMDSEYDRVRAVRDARYRYVYNYMPEQPYYQNIAFRMMLPMMRELLKLHAEHQLPPITEAWFGSKPVEELYDVESDPWELHNLAGDPTHRDKLVELRAALHDWTARYGDMGSIPEMEMVRQMWNGADTMPVTEDPVVTPTADGVALSCATEGASIGYWIEGTGEVFTARPHPVKSWDYGVLYGNIFGAMKESGQQELPLFKLLAQNRLPRDGDNWPRQKAWQVYRGEKLKLRPGEILHVNAQRIGYGPAEISYAMGP